MREIKFRAWDKELNKMLNVTQLDFADWWVQCGYDNHGLGERNSFQNQETDRHILEQFTGLHDKNGVEIYEGDKVFDGKYYGIIEYRECSFVINWEIDCSHDDDLNYWNDKIEVIGNIHERSE